MQDFVTHNPYWKMCPLLVHNSLPSAPARIVLNVSQKPLEVERRSGSFYATFS